MKKFKNLIIIMFSICAIYTLFTGSYLKAQEKDAPEVKENITEAPKKNSKTDKLEVEKDIKLNTIVITGTRTKEKQKDVPSNLEVITSKEIEATGIKTLGDVIGQKVTGHYHRYSGLSQPAGLMGNLAADTMGDDTGNRILVLVDGHKLGTGNLGKIPPEIIDRLEVIKGSASALYGSAAMGGVINIITKKGSGNIKNTVNLETGSFDYSRTAISGGGDINEFAGYFITGSYMKTGDYKTKNYGTAYNSGENQAQIWGNLGLYPANDQSIRIGFSYADIINQYPSYENHTYYDETTKNYSDLSRGHIDLEYNLGIPSNKLNWKASLYYLWDKRSWFEGDSTNVESNATIRDNYTAGTDQQFEITSIPLNKIVFGYSFELLRGENKDKQAGVIVEDTTPDFRYYSNSAYCQDTISLLENSLLFILGARYDRYDLDIDHSGSHTKDFSFDNISPRGGIVYKIFDMFRIRGNAGRAFRAPNAEELTGYYYYPGIYGATYQGSLRSGQSLKPETSTTYDAGIDFYPKDINIGATYSYIKTKDLITYKYSGTNSDGNPLYLSSNVDRAEMEIIDCYINWEAGKTLSLPVGLTLSSNFTYNKKYEDEKTGEKLPYIADREIKSNIQTIYKSLTVTLAHIYVGHENLTYGNKKGSFYLFNLTSNYGISPVISIQLGIFNLTNEDYEWVKYYPAPERNYKIGITGKF